MIPDIATIVRKELKELVVTHASKRAGLAALALPLGILGVVAPWHFGSAWFDDTLVYVVWALLPIPVVIAAAAESVAGERERHTLETLLASPLSDRAILTGKIVAAMLYGWLFSIAVLLLGLITFNVVQSDSTLLLVSPAVGLSSLSLGLLTSLLTACAGVLVSLRVATVRQAQVTLSLILLVLGFTLAAAGALLLYLLPNPIQVGLLGSSTATAVLLLALLLFFADAALFVAASNRFRRSYLLAG